MIPRNIKILKRGTNVLRLFIAMLIFDLALVAYGIASGFSLSDLVPKWIFALIALALVETCVFWVGILMVYGSSIQLGIKHRIWGIVLGWVPIANIIMLVRIVKICTAETATEIEKAALNESRSGDRICQTRYPILLVHGVFFRDSEVLNYWGRVPKQLTMNGATVFYGQHRSAASVTDSAMELEARINEVLKETGCEKVNIIAHSKGGLDARAAIALTSAGDHVASLTTINSPHRGCEFADYFLNVIPKEAQLAIAKKYNMAAAKLGDTDPDFIAAVYDLTAASCAKFNESIKDRPDVFYQWVGSVQNKATSGKLPLNLTYGIVKLFDGRNDGLVGENSFPWGEKYAFLDNGDNRGISHSDMIDLNRENIPGFDVREFYVQLVADLKRRGF